MRYKIIYADPPWRFRNKNTGGSMKSGADAKYPTMTVKELSSLVLPADDDCTLFMWWVASQPQAALDLVKAWGFTVKTMTGFTWVKQTSTGKPFFGMGFWSRQGSENCLVAVKGNPKRISASVRAVVHAPVGEHSKKPDIFSGKIVELMGDLPRLEMFARDEKPGWDVFGHIEGSIDLNFPENA